MELGFGLSLGLGDTVTVRVCLWAKLTVNHFVNIDCQCQALYYNMLMIYTLCTSIISVTLTKQKSSSLLLYPPVVKIPGVMIIIHKNLKDGNLTNKNNVK